MGRVVGGGRTSGTGSPVRLIVLVAAVTLALAGCGGGDGNAKVKLAESRVSAKEKALTEAKTDLASKTAAFCTSSASYLTALDRYGDVLHRTAPTVGDVK